jgi:hypothetical protein
VTPDEADQRCADPGPEVVDPGDLCQVEGAEASKVFESGVCFARFAVGFLEPSALVAFGPAISLRAAGA